MKAVYTGQFGNPPEVLTLCDLPSPKPSQGEGTWQELVRVPCATCVPVPDDIDNEAAVSLYKSTHRLVNDCQIFMKPFTMLCNPA